MDEVRSGGRRPARQRRADATAAVVLTLATALVGVAGPAEGLVGPEVPEVSAVMPDLGVPTTSGSTVTAQQLTLLAAGLAGAGTGVDGVPVAPTGSSRAAAAATPTAAPSSPAPSTTPSPSSTTGPSASPSVSAPPSATVTPSVSASTTSTGPTVAAPSLPMTFARSGFAARPVVVAQLPYVRREQMPVDDTGVHDAAGVRMVIVAGTMYDHPVAQAAYGLDLLESYRLSGNRVFLDRAIAQANRLVDRRVVTGSAWFYPYPFDFALHGRSADLVRAPWYSGMAQGLALSLFVRLQQLTGTASWGTAADATFGSFQVGPAAGRPWVSRVDATNQLWLEEYPRWPAATSDRTINGFEFALMGLYEYAALRHSTAATLLWDGGLTTLLAAVAAAANPAWASRYCLAHDVASESYHLLVVNLLGFLEHESGSSRLGRLADRLVDAYPPPVSGSLRITLQPGTVTAVKYSSTGAVVARRTLRLTRRSEARADLRHRVKGGPIAYRMTNGYFAGYEVTEVPKVSYALGRYVHTDYQPARTATVRAGSRLTGAQLSAVGGTLRSKSVTFPTKATASFDGSEFVNGRRWTHLTSGPLAGYWVPTTSILLD